MAKQEQSGQRFSPKWDEMMAILASPKQEAVFVNRSVDPKDWDGSWDFQAAQRGVGMRRVAADVGKSNSEIETPAGFVFVCHCGYARRVVDSEQAFTCERPNAAGPPGCGILWQKECREEDYDPMTGRMKYAAVMETRVAPNGRKYQMPKIYGEPIAQFRRRTLEAARNRGQAALQQPQGLPQNDVKEPLVVEDKEKGDE